MIYPFCVSEESLYSPRFCQFVLSSAGWLKGGATLWATDDVLELADRVNEGIMVCYEGIRYEDHYLSLTQGQIKKKVGSTDAKEGLPRAITNRT